MTPWRVADCPILPRRSAARTLASTRSPSSVIFSDRATYDRVRESGVLSRDAVCRIFGIDAAQITDHVAFKPALAIKFTMYRRIPSGSPGDADVFGSQQYGPLLDLELPGVR
jgi:hypothetical protein